MAVLISRLGGGIRPHVTKVIAGLVCQYGTGKTGVKPLAMRTMMELMTHLSPSLVLRYLLTYLAHDNIGIKVDVLNTLIMTLLTFKNHNFDFVSLTLDIAESFNDSRARVGYTAVEACAVMVSLAGKEAIIQALLDKDVDPDTIKHLEARFSDHSLPQLSSDGTVEHIISLSRAASPGPALHSLLSGSLPPFHLLPLGITSTRKEGSMTPTLPNEDPSYSRRVGEMRSSAPGSPSRRTRSLPWEKEKGFVQPLPSRRVSADVSNGMLLLIFI